MREIKFRGWSGETMDYKIFGPGVYLYWFEETGIQSWEELKKFFPVLMQYTGEKDMNGVEIYEGDILQDNHGRRCDVKFDTNCNCCHGVIGFTCMSIGRSGIKSPSELLVIGNIYQNPELLKKDVKCNLI